MGRKVKVGAQRKDKFYRLAKETGYRSRASFKLVQLNRKFEFLQRSKVVVDLCAAPGGWLQAAAQHMPVSNLIIGVDLVSIRPLPNVITLQGDITTDKTRQSIKKELKTWEADCVLNDGAPNVGKNWLHDAFAQAQLTLSALKIACSVLRKGGWFVTKVFRSKDYPALISVFDKLFKKVHVTKPQASRSESAEIFVVCQSYLKPITVDPQLLDPKSVFKDVHLEPETPRLNLVHPEKKRKKAVGYTHGDYTLFHRVPASEFAQSQTFLELLADANEIEVDDKSFLDLPETSEELLLCLKDIKVLGRKELRLVLNWRKTIKKYLKEEEAKNNDDSNLSKGINKETELDEDELIDKEIAEAQADEKSKLKRKKRKLQKEKKVRKDKIGLKMILPGDKPDIPDQQDLFSLKRINNVKALNKVIGAKRSAKKELDSTTKKSKMDTNDQMEDHPLLVDEETGMNKNEKLKRRTEQWFNRDAFIDIETEKDEDEAIERFLDKIQQKPKDTKPIDTTEDSEPIEGQSCFDKEKVEDDEDDLDENDEKPPPEEISQDNTVGKRKKKRIKLDAEGMALGEMMIYSSKTRRQLIEQGYNRYTNNDDNLPDWFAVDEKKHYKKMLPVTKEAMNEYKARLKELNARPIKKVAEAKLRKKKRGMARLAKAKKKAETITDNPDLSTQQKARELKKVYGKQKKREIPYVVVTKGNKGKMSRPRGPYKAVDKRLKKDNRNPKVKTGTRGKTTVKPKSKEQQKKEKRRSMKKRKGKS